MELITWREFVLAFLFLGIIVGFILLIRAYIVFKFTLRLINEEYEYHKQRCKEFIPYLRSEALPQYKMVFMFWIPLKKFERPLSDFYKD